MTVKSNKIHLSVVCKKHFLALKISTILEGKDGQNYSNHMGPGSKDAWHSDEEVYFILIKRNN